MKNLLTRLRPLLTNEATVIFFCCREGRDQLPETAVNRRLGDGESRRDQAGGGAVERDFVRGRNEVLNFCFCFLFFFLMKMKS